MSQLLPYQANGNLGQLNWVGYGGGKEIITSLVEPYTAHYTQTIDYSAYLITVVSCFPRAGVVPPLRFPLGLLCRFSANDMESNFFGFFLSAQFRSVSKLISSLQVFKSSSTTSSSTCLVALRFTPKAHTTCQSSGTVSSGVKFDRVQPDCN